MQRKRMIGTFQLTGWRLWEHAPAQEHRDFLRVNTVVFRFASMDSFPI